MKRLNYFQKAQIKLTVQYFIVSLIIITIFSFTAIAIEVRDVSPISKSTEIGPIAKAHRLLLEKNVNRVHRRFMEHLLILDGVLLLLVVGTSYYHSGKTLRPIKDMMQKQEEFASDVSHELRTPLTTINMEIEAQRRTDKKLPPAYGKLLDSIQDETNHMTDTVGGLLMLVRSDLPDEANNRTPLDLADVAKQAIEKVSVPADAKRILLSAGKIAEAPITGNEEQIRQIVFILLDNAIRYTPGGGEISVTTESDKRTSSLTVADTGIGIPEKDHGRIFERLYRVDDKRIDTERRTGLGLSIARKIVENHGGTISVSSTPGEGSLFTIKFPHFSS